MPQKGTHMKVNVTSQRGHHEAVMEPEIAEAVFNKMTGRTVKALDPSFKVKIPDTFGELEALWRDGPGGYTALGGKGDDLRLVREFDPTVEEMTFIAPIAGG